jgi:metal-sulfur cluster biosynthetic enzyme
MRRDLRHGEESYAERTDDVPTKVRLLLAAQQAGRYDLALALANSLKDTLQNERMRLAGSDTPALEAGGWQPISALPAPWAVWAGGWTFYQVVLLEELAGLPRQDEPVDLIVALPVEGVASPAREIRVARLDEAAGTLHEVPCQVYGEVRRGRAWQVHVVFPASVPPHGRGVYLAFCGNPAAELPHYPTALRVRGEGYGLDIETRHYVALLSRQMGQLERLVSKHRHGLELYAGGEGHGEPPNIDWAHDYLAAGGFQKFRLTNWAVCPNYDVVRGPLCCIVRRFGFPHSPVHPLFTPSRFFIDVTYTFFAEVPYFLKDSRMEAVQDFTLNYARDDEWVFSGYSFTDILWMDEDGRVHAGAVPPEHADRMWGVGFFHRTSRDCFFAIRLAHRLEPPPGAGPDATAGIKLYHADAPTLNYQGHGQLWSRWFIRDNPRLPAGVAFVQRNAYVLGSYPEGSGAAELEALRRRLLHPLTIAAGDLPAGVTARRGGALARPGERPEDWPHKHMVWDALREVRDEMLYTVDANVVDMGYIYDVRLQGADVYVLMTMPHQGRPRYNWLGNPIRRRLEQLPGIRSVVVEHTWEPAWTPNRLTDAGRRAMGLET